jgi:chemotaxis response regulator CheB
MFKQRIILVSDSRLLRELFYSVIYKAEHLEVVQVIRDPGVLPFAIEHLQAEWVIMPLSGDNDIPAWVDAYIAEHPFMRFLFISYDTSQIKMKWLEQREEDLDNLSLSDLIHILEKNP